jgi:signal transduction histidine kinase
MHGKESKSKISGAERRRQLYELRERRREIFQHIHESRYNEQVDMRKQMHDLEAAMDALRGGRGHRTHENPFDRPHNFDQYYKRIRHTRVAFILVNIILWSLLFILSGPVTVAKVIIVILAVITTLTNVFELMFLLGVRNRILYPIDNLKKGVAEIMKGNYTVVVDPHAGSEVSGLIDAFNDMAHTLYEDEKLKEEYERNRKLLIANISHDLKTPITSIQGYIEAIEDQQTIPPEKLKKYLTIILNNARYMNRLIDDLFLFSKLDMQKLKFDFADVDIRRYMGDLMEEFRLELSERNALLRYTDELPEASRVRIDPKRFHQVIRNIIDNAVKYGPGEGLAIDVRLYTQGGSVCLDLADNGPGIPADQLDRVFERFYRMDAERTKDTESTGLGLAIARELVAAHGGAISVASPGSAGSRFTIALPMHTPEKEAAHEEHTDH